MANQVRPCPEPDGAKYAVAAVVGHLTVILQIAACGGRSQVGAAHSELSAVQQQAAEDTHAAGQLASLLHQAILKAHQRQQPGSSSWFDSEFMGMNSTQYAMHPCTTSSLQFITSSTSLWKTPLSYHMGGYSIPAAGSYHSRDRTSDSLQLCCMQQMASWPQSCKTTLAWTYRGNGTIALYL